MKKPSQKNRDIHYKSLLSVNVLTVIAVTAGLLFTLNMAPPQIHQQIFPENLNPNFLLASFSVGIFIFACSALVLSYLKYNIDGRNKSLLVGATCLTAGALDFIVGMSALYALSQSILDTDSILALSLTRLVILILMGVALLLCEDKKRKNIKRRHFTQAILVNTVITLGAGFVCALPHVSLDIYDIAPHYYDLIKNTAVLTPLIIIAGLAWYFPKLEAENNTTVSILLYYLSISSVGYAYYSSSTLLNLDASISIYYLFLASAYIIPTTKFLGRLRSYATNSLELKRSNRRLTKQLKQTRSLNESVFSKLSHDIRTPLNGIIGASDMMLKSDAKLDKNLKTHLRNIINSGYRLLYITQDSMEFSKIEKGDVNLRPNLFNIKDIILRVLNSCASYADEKNLKLRVEIGEKVPECLLSDEHRLIQILHNLVNNAIVIATKGEIHIKVSVSSEKHEDIALLFSIGTYGAYPHSTLLSEFFQTGQRPELDLNPGLIISKRLCDLFGGQIWLSSSDNHSSIFMTIKAKKGSYMKKEVNDNSPEIREIKQNLNILIAEDNKINQLILSKALQNLGYGHISVVSDGDKVIKAFEKKWYDVVFMDVEMPKINGIEATKVIRDYYKDPKSPIIIALTANALPEDRVKCLNAGMNDYIAKPFDAEDIEGSLTKILLNQDLMYG